VATRMKPDDLPDPTLPLIVGAFLMRDNRVLLGYRNPARREYPATWDMIGGHVERDEAPTEAIKRELTEELGIDATIDEPFTTVKDAAFGTLTVWRVTHWHGVVANCAPEEHTRLEWFAPEDIDTLAFPHPAYPQLITSLFAP
jgi:8-oxo-dGTP diphosphatase